MNSDQHQAEINAKQDADTYISKFLWVVVGFFGNIVGILIAVIYQPTPPALHLLDMSEEYIVFYTDAYKTRARTIQLTYAFVGLVIPAVLIYFFIHIG
jgi:hypothetical protein